MSFTDFVKPYPNGYEDGESGNTPVTAEILNTNYDGFLLGLNEFLPELAGMVEANPSESATAGNLTKLKVGNSIYLVPSGGSGGSTVEWEQIQLTGTRIATITIDNVPVDVYVPSGGGSGDEVEWTQVLGSGTKIGTITINNTPIDVYAPTPIDVEANPSGSATAGDLTKLKVGSSIYSIPSGGSGGASTEIIADDFDATSTYAVGDYVVYDGKLYKCTTAVSTAGQWDANDWTETIVMDEVGGGGGGTGGHTIIDENGNSMTARAGLQFVGGANVSDDSTNDKTIVDLASAGGIDGVFIDANDVIKDDFTIDGTAHDWIATEDCIVYAWLLAKDQYTSAYLNINSESAFVTLNTTVGETAYIPVKKGQTLAYRSKSGTYTRIKAYGIQTGTTHSKFQPIIYSTEEREIGVWIDSRPLYEKTVDFGALPNNTTKTVSYNISDLDYFVKIQCVAHNQNGSRNIPFVDDANKSSDVLLDTIKSSGAIRIISNNDLSSLTGEVTLQYVKTTDVAGSGSWTPQGVPTHHYSTDEQVIGTWVDGNTIYEKTYELSTAFVINAHTWGTTNIDVSFVDKFIGAADIVTSGGQGYVCFTDVDNSNNLQLYNPRYDAGIGVKSITIKYTKSS